MRPMEAQRQLKGIHTAQAEDRAGQGAGGREQQAEAGASLLHQGSRVGSYPDQLLGAGEHADNGRCWLGRASLQPGAAPAHDVSSQAGKHDLQTDTGGRMAHPHLWWGRCRVLHVKGSLHLFVAGFNGLITNDKFCLSRTGHLTLTWSRRPVRLREPSTGDPLYLSDTEAHRGGAHETPVEDSPRVAGHAGRAAPLGPGLPTPSAMDHAGRARPDVPAQTLPKRDTGGVR
jgi:hypothetical protein